MSAFDDRHGLSDHAPAMPPPAAWWKPAPGGKPSPGPGADDYIPFEKVTCGGVEYSGAPWRATGRLILPGGGANGDLDATAIAAASGISIASTATAQDVTSFAVPDGKVVVIREALLWVESDIGWQFVTWNLIIGGASGVAQSGKQGRAIDPSMVRPLDLCRPIDVGMIAVPGSTIRLQATNSSTESPHIAKGELRGKIWPAWALEMAKKNCGGASWR